MCREITYTSSGSPCKLESAVLQKSLIAVFCSVVLFAWTGEAFALVHSAKAPTTTKKKVVSNITVTGPTVKCHQWGFLELQLKVQKTVVTSATGKPKVS